ncbi:MAG: MoxR family ATPase [Akkermansiaceae bacterium]
MKPAPVTRLDHFPKAGRLLPSGWLRSLGVYGYDAVEDVVLASLVTGDPLLLIGMAGTGKTFLLNSLSEALGLEHRHYNASLIAFDDLVGFPYPMENGTQIRYIETPATIWQAESVLIDELSRCRPEHQNRLFSLVHERRIQGLSLPKLRYRWAAMNPCEAENSDDFYEGSVALDQALADRFAFIIEVPDWAGLKESDRLLVADARGVDVLSIDQTGLLRAVEEGRRRFAAASDELHETALAYTSVVATQLLQPGVRLSPRRVRLLSRNLVALTLVSGGQPERDVFRTGLRASLPQLAWGVRVADPVLRGAHGVAWDMLTRGPQERWLSQVMVEANLAKRCTLLFDGTQSQDTVSLAIRQSLVQLPKAQAAVLALALLPAVRDRAATFGEESLAAVVEVAAPILEVEGEANWRLNIGLDPGKNPHPSLSECAVLLESLPPRRRERARQLFYHCIVSKIPLPDPTALEAQLDRAIRVTNKFLKTAKP